VLNDVHDFCDNWDHRIVVEKIVPTEGGVAHPVCVGGRRAAPPEDCGGLWGYEDLLVAIGDVGHDEHDSMLERRWPQTRANGGQKESGSVILWKYRGNPLNTPCHYCPLRAARSQVPVRDDVPKHNAGF
jgi:hypothetical protein